MGTAFGETGVFCRIKPRIDAGEDREVAARRKRQVALAPEILCISHSQPALHPGFLVIVLAFRSNARALGFETQPCSAVHRRGRRIEIPEVVILDPIANSPRSPLTISFPRIRLMTSNPWRH
jgi:hypothetical protein